MHIAICTPAAAPTSQTSAGGREEGREGGREREGEGGKEL
jgi:hypothetical protein